MSEEKKPQGWKDVYFSSEMPLSVLVSALNVLNQRLCAIEDVVQVPYDNRLVTLTELYEIQGEKQQEEQKAKEEKGE